MKDELAGKIMNEFAALRAKTYSYLTDINDKKAKGTKKCAVKSKLKFQDYKHCLKASQLEKKNHLEKTNLNVDILQENHEEFTKKKKLY